MRFMIIRRADAQTEAGALPTAELMDAMGRYMEEMGNAGILRGGTGLHPSAKGARVKFDGGRPAVIDGPFTETKELIAGYHIIDVPTLEDAIAWTRKWPTLDADGAVELEIRPLIEPEDFGEAFTEEMRRARAHLERVQ
jgi:hypothetical protein